MSHAEHHEHAAHAAHERHEMPTGGNELPRVAISATLHCLTGCAIGEVLGMIIGHHPGLLRSANHRAGGEPGVLSSATC